MINLLISKKDLLSCIFLILNTLTLALSVYIDIPVSLLFSSIFLAPLSVVLFVEYVIVQGGCNEDKS